MKKNYQFRLAISGIIFILGVGFFAFSFYRLLKLGYSLNLKYPLRIEKILEALREGKKSWSYDTKEAPLPMNLPRK